MTLYELTEELRALYEMAEEPDVDAQALADTIDAVSGELEIKADGYAKVMRQMDCDIASVKAEIDRLSNRKKQMENNKESIKNALEMAMRATGKTKFKTDLFSFGIQKNPPSIKIAADIDINNVPADFLKFSDPEIDKAKVKEALKSGEEFEWAHLEQTEGLRIK